MWAFPPAPNRDTYPLYVNRNVIEGNEHEKQYAAFADDAANMLAFQVVVRMKDNNGYLLQQTEFLLNGKIVGDAQPVTPSIVQYTESKTLQLTRLLEEPTVTGETIEVSPQDVNVPRAAYLTPLVITMVVDPDAVKSEPVQVKVYREKIKENLREEREQLLSFSLQPSGSFDRIHKCFVVPCPDVIQSSTIYIYGKGPDEVDPNNPTMTKELLNLGSGVSAVRKITSLLLELMEIPASELNLQSIKSPETSWTNATRAVFGLLLPPAMVSPASTKHSTKLVRREGPKIVTSVTVETGTRTTVLAPPQTLEDFPENEGLKASYLENGVIYALKELLDACVLIANRIGTVQGVITGDGPQPNTTQTRASSDFPIYNKDYAFARLTNTELRGYDQFIAGRSSTRFAALENGGPRPSDTLFQEVAFMCVPGAVNFFSRDLIQPFDRQPVVVASNINQRILPGVLQFESPGSLGAYTGTDDEHGNVSRAVALYSKMWTKGVSRAKQVVEESARSNAGLGVRLTRHYTPQTGFDANDGFDVERFFSSENYDAFPRITWLAGLLPGPVSRAIANAPGVYRGVTESLNLKGSGYLSKLKLSPDPESSMAVASFFEMVAFEAMNIEPDAEDSPTRRMQTRKRLIDSAVRNSQRRAGFASEALRDALRLPSFPYKDDGFFFGTRGGMDALFALRNFDMAGGLWGDNDITAKVSLELFVKALATLSSSGISLGMNPVNLPFLAAQSLTRLYSPFKNRAFAESEPLRETLQSIVKTTHGSKSGITLDSEHMMIISQREAMSRVRSISFPPLDSFVVYNRDPPATNESAGLHAALGMCLMSRPLLTRLDTLPSVAEERPKTFQDKIPDFPAYGMNPSFLQSVWGSRCVDRWTEDAYTVVDGTESLVRQMSRVALDASEQWTGKRTFYVPFGASGSSGIESMPQVSEMRVWIKASKQFLDRLLVVPVVRNVDGTVQIPVMDAAAGGTITFRMQDIENGSTYVHPFLYTFERRVNDSSIVFPVLKFAAQGTMETTTMEFVDPAAGAEESMSFVKNLMLMRFGTDNKPYLNDFALQRVRTLMFTAERIYQAMTAVVAQGRDDSAFLPNVVFDMTNDYDEIFLRAMAIAMGMLANLTDKAPLSVSVAVPENPVGLPGLPGGPGPVDQMLARIVDLKQAFARAALHMKVAPLSELCARAAL